jgi:hypothetical protein
LAYLNLSNDEIKFAYGIQKMTAYLLIPTPLFILSPISIDFKNQVRVSTTINHLLKDPCFVKAAIDSLKINQNRLEMIVMGASCFELWKRYILMRIQWVLQILALLVFAGVLWKL